MGRLRAAGRVAALLALLIACLVLYFVWQLRGTHNPWPRTFLRTSLRVIGVRLRTTGPATGTGTVLLANHVSWIDIPALAGSTGTAFVAHDGLASVPLVHWLCRLNDTVFVARGNRTRVAEQIEQVRNAFRDTDALTIFPEGTTGDGAGLLPFKSSLLSAIDPPPESLAVQPVWIDYGAESRSIAWVGDEPGLTNFLRIVGRARPLAVTVHFLEPLAGEALANRKAMAAAARAAIAAAMSAASAKDGQRVAL